MNPASLAALHRLCFTVPRPFTEKEFTGLLASPEVFLCSGPNGFALGRVIADEAELLTLAVDPAARRQGLGRRLMAEFLTQSQALGAVLVFLEVDQRNSPAIALYQAFGFAEMGRRPRYYRHPDGPSDALVMRLATDDGL